jgi:hypothetical protein
VRAVVEATQVSGKAVRWRTRIFVYDGSTAVEGEALSFTKAEADPCHGNTSS